MSEESPFFVPRYALWQASSGEIMRIDRATGRTWELRRRADYSWWRLVEEGDPMKPAEMPKSLTE